MEFIQVDSDIGKLRILLDHIASFERNHLPKIIKASTKRMERRAKKMIRTGQRTGRKHSGRKTPRRSSAPGEPPQNQTGSLARSIKSGFTASTTHGTAQGIIDVLAPHGQWLETGTRNMEARPFLQPTIETELPILRNAIERALSS